MSVCLVKRLVGFAACIVVVAGGLVVGVAAPSSAHPGVPSSLFDPNVVSWASYRNYPAGSFNTLVAEQRAAGRMLIDIDADKNQGQCGCQYGGAFQRNLDGRDWIFLDNVTEFELRQAIDRFRALNMRLVDLEPIDVGRWAALWVENVEGYDWNAIVGVLAQSIQAFSDTERAAGRLLVDVDAFGRTGGVFSAISVRNAGNVAWTLVLGATSHEFNLVFNALRSTHRPLVADSAPTSDGQRFSGIWLRNTNGRGWVIWRNLTIDEWAQTWQEQADAGNRVINYERYETADGPRYLGIWRQNH